MLIPFIEKYRPLKLDDMIGIDKDFFRNIINNPKSLHNLLFYSTCPGSGKTSLSKVIVNELKADALILNASDERSIEVIRGKIKRFVETMSINPNSPKIVILDEVDGMKGRGDDTQMALRALMENQHTKFILTCNDINKVIEPLQSRCIKIDFQYPPKDEIKTFLKGIIEKEELKIEDKVLVELVNVYYPSIRDMVTHLYKCKLEGIKNIEKIERKEDVKEELFKDIVNGRLIEARTKWLEKNINLRNLLYYFFKRVFEIRPDTIEEAVDLIARTDYRLSVHADPDITFFDFVIKFFNLTKR